MHVQVRAESDDLAEQVRQLLDFYLTGLVGQVQRVEIAMQTDRDSCGTRLFRCRLHASPWRGEPIEIEEQQADLALAVTRVLDRCSRTLRRRQHGLRQGLIHPA